MAVDVDFRTFSGSKFTQLSTRCTINWENRFGKWLLKENFFELLAKQWQLVCRDLPIFRRDAVVASTHWLPVFLTSASRDVLLSAIGCLLLPVLDFGTVYLLTSSLPCHSAENSFISTILPKRCFITMSP